MNKLHCFVFCAENIDMNFCSEEMHEIYDDLPTNSLPVQYRKLE